MIQISYRLTKKEYITESIRQYIKTKIFWFCIVLFFLSNFLGTKNSSDANPLLILAVMIVSYLFLALIFTIFVVILIWFLIYFRIRKMSHYFGGEIKYTFDKNKVITETSLGKTETNWDFFKKAIITKNIVRFKVENPASNFLFIPRRAFKTQAEFGAFQDLLREKKLIR